MTKLRKILGTGVPAGCAAIPVHSDDAAAPLRLCAMVRLDPRPGVLFTLRCALDVQVVLGCITDASGYVQRWVELWIQNVDGLAASPAALTGFESLTNVLLDHKWRRRFRAVEQLSPAAVVRTGWETHHAPPVLLDVERNRAVHPVDPESGRAWRLCEDDRLLEQAGLPPYTGSLHRYLHLDPREAPDQTPRFVPVTVEAPTNERTVEIESIIENLSELVPLTVGGGYLMVRPHEPLSYAAMIELLSAGCDVSIRAGAPQDSDLDLRFTDPADAASPFEHMEDFGRLFLGRSDRNGRLLEMFHLKLRLLADAVAAVHHLVRETQTPMLDLSDNSFRVSLAAGGFGVPHYWTARAALVESGQALRLPIGDALSGGGGGGGRELFVRGSGEPQSIYHAVHSTQPVRGRGIVRIRQVIDDGDEVTGPTGRAIIEGTLVTHERLNVSTTDLVWIRLPIPGRGSGAEVRSQASGRPRNPDSGEARPASRLDLYVTMEKQAAMADGEWRFRSSPLLLSSDMLRHVERTSGGEVEFDLIPNLSTPCDLYSLGVLAARTLLVNAPYERGTAGIPGATLPMALDDIHSLARQVAATYEEAVGLPLRIMATFDRDERWLASLGPHRLWSEEVAPEEAFEAIPREIWWETLAMIVRTIPGLPDSACRDAGDSRPGGAHRVFERMLNDLRSLIIQTRSLVVVDWSANREIHAVVRGFQRALEEKDGRTVRPI